ncbi:IS110 family transposase [Granulicella aggregans]|uniref:IS110 family transposase n=1 Tax=Granulicella aggregans TaxID=474949 RepID=UPI0037C0B236
MQTVRSFVGMDVHKETISISVAEDGRNGPVRFIGVIPNQPDDIAKMAKRLAKHGELDFCYEAGGCGYNIYRQLTALGHSCTVAATSLIPRKPGERIKTDRRDSQKLAILHRSGDLTKVWVPDATHEALRDLVRARVDASMHLMRARQQLLAFLLRHGRSYAVTSHSSQGQTADRVLIHVDSAEGHGELLNSRMAYVSVSRAQYDVKMYTNDAKTLGFELSRDVTKTTALDHPEAGERIKPQSVGLDISLGLSLG